MSKFDLSLNKDNSANIETTPEYIDMDKLSLSAPLEFLAKYDSPREWILEQEEAERVKTFTEPFNIKVDALEKAEYGVGEALYNLGRSPAELSQLGLGLASGMGKLIFPHSTDTALDRLYKNIALNNAKNREERESIVTAYTGGDSDIVKWTEGIAELGIMLGTAGAAAGIGASAARRGISKLATETAKGVATRPSVVRRASSIAAARGAKAGQVAATIGTTFAQEAGAPTTEKVRQYIAKTGDTQLKNYNPFEDSLTSLAVGAINSAIEVGFGVERFIPEFWGTGTNFNRAARRFVEGFLGEGAEEFSQSVVSQLGDIINGYKDNIDWWEAFDNAIVGGVLGGSAGFGMYHLNRIRMARQLSNDYNMPYKKAAEFVDDMLGTGIERTTNELSARAELKNENGSAWNKMVTGVKTAMSTVNFGDEQSRDNQATLFARTNAQIAMRLARESGLSTDEFLDIAEFSAMNNGDNLNMIFLKPLGTVADIDRRIAEQDSIITRERELKKTGAGDNKILQDARMRKNILQKAKAIKEFQTHKLQEQIAAQTTPELKTEIDTAKKDAESLGNIESFNEKNPEATTSEKVKRYGNAVIKKLFGKDTAGFNAVMVLPEATNAKNAIITVADRINNFIKAHRTYDLKADLVNALNKLQTVTQENFIDSISYPALDGVDVTAENAFLYHFLFSDETTISKFLDSYITRAEQSVSGETKVPLSKKDLVGQAFKATDDMMQTQAQLTNTEYQSIYDTTGNIIDKNVLAVMLSYQNQFVSEPTSIKTIEYTDKEVLGIFAKAKNNGNITLDNWEYVRWSSLLSAGDTYQKGKRNKPATEAEKAKFARKMLDKYMPGWNSRPKQTLEQFDLADENARLDEIYPEYKGETIVVDGKERTVYNSNGDRIAKSKEALTNFWRWFGDSKVVDGQDRPLVVYHGTSSKFDTFKVGEHGGTYGTGIYFGRKSTADLYGIYAMPVYLKIENPFIVEGNNYRELAPKANEAYKEYIRKDQNAEEDWLIYDDDIINWYLKAQGFDGIIDSKYIATGANEFVVFEPTQIKSVDNRGTYSEKTGNIYFQSAMYLNPRQEIQEFVKYVLENPKAKKSYITTTTNNNISIDIPSDTVLHDENGHALTRTQWADAIKALNNIKSVAESKRKGIYGKSLLIRGETKSGKSFGFVVDIADGRNILTTVFENTKTGIESWQKERAGRSQGAAANSAHAVKFYTLGQPAFNDIIDTLKSNVKSEILPQGRAANGFYDPEIGVIVLGRNMNEMTLPHEMQHYWLDTIFNIYKRAKSGELKVKDGWMESTKDLLNMLGVDENQTQLTKGQHEKFARMSEAYLTGIGISGDQNQTFKEYLSWVPEKYKSILQLGYLNDKGMVEYPVLDIAAVEFFNKWYGNPSLTTLPTSPERQNFVNPIDDKGEVSTVSIKEMNNREKEFGQDAEEQAKTDQRFYNVLDENMPSDIKSEADGQKVVIQSRSNFLKESENQQRRWFERKSHDTEAQKAQEYIENNTDHAKEIVYGDPELVPNDSGPSKTINNKPQLTF